MAQPFAIASLSPNRPALTSTASTSSPNARPDIYARNLQRTAKQETSLSALAFLFSALVQQLHKTCTGVPELERKLADHGYRVGVRALDLSCCRDPARSRKREHRLLGMLQWVSGTLWRSLFNKPADALEQARDASDEYMIYDNAPLVCSFISTPKELGALSCAAFIAGILEGCLDAAGFPCSVTAHAAATPELPLKSVFLIKLDASVMQREAFLS
ncbi:transport protein particle subunit trs31 [Protomyces lactucae-debilis]|uniref:Trafficking protein particle complex subunit n=1 Tax=Protomyces lactucae-debilis TaxID=2754530 RepID=A0A1Y2FPC6_PROLT|nr:transport protein particle subunit trs31 [Protomyces lactucae-debilis]ORY85447.1 transport protein particle subunit trs31 [Protomyces lactucae-debilis]